MRQLIRSIGGAALCLCALSFAVYSQNCGADDLECKVTSATKRISADPSDLEAFYDRGLANEKLKRYDEAVADFSRYIAGKPTNKQYLADGYGERANSYKQQAKYKAALADYNSALSLYVNTNYYNNRGNCYMSMGDNENALADFNRAIALDAKDPEPYYNRAKVYSSQKLYSKAVADLNTYVGLNTTNIPFLADGYQNRAIAYQNLNNLVQALKDATKAIELDPTVPSRFTARANIYRKLGKTSLAEADESAADSLK